MKNLFRKIKQELLILRQKDFDLTTQEGRAAQRHKKIVLTAVTAMLARVIAMVVPLVTVRVSLAYLGEEIYGLWTTVNSFFTLFAFADLGLGNGLQTRLSQASGKENNETECQRLISSTYAILLAVAFGMIGIFAALYPFVSWAGLINAQTPSAIALAGPVFCAIVIPKFLNVPLNLVQRTQLALQEGYQANIWQCVGNFLSLISVYISAALNLGPFTLILLSSLIPVVVSLLNMIFFFGFQRQGLAPSFRLVRASTAKTMFSTGMKFFFLSILTTIGLNNMDSFIVARTTSLAGASTFSIMLRVASLLNVVIQMAASPLWSANGEAFARKDYSWIAKNTKRASLLMAGVTALATFAVMVFARIGFSLWIGPNFSFSYATLLGMLLMQVLFSFINPYFMVLNGTGVVLRQIFIFSIFTPLSFALKYILSLRLGSTVIPWVGCVCYALIVIPYIVKTAVHIYRTGNVRDSLLPTH